MNIKSLTFAVLVASVSLAIPASAFDWNPLEWFQGKAPASRESLSGTPTPTISTSAPIGVITAPNYRAIAERYGPAVVGINTEGVARNPLKGLPDPFGDDPFFEFFRGLPGFKGFVPHGEFPVRGQGSGFIVAKNGLILTNAHVVRNADEVTVKLSDRREFKAKVIGSDKATDVAVLKINADNLPVVTLGDPSQLRVGDYVLAIGSPFGFEQSATAGIVSAKGRSLPGDAHVPFIQTDAAVNPGSSGGPLFDASGFVVGINSQIYSQTGGYQGLSFAIPIDVALKVKDQIISGGKVVHARLGVTIQELNKALAESFKLARPEGALVSSVDADSGAAKAGIEPGDVILKYNSQPIVRSGDLPSLVEMAKPGDIVKLEVWRAGKKIELTATLAEAKDKISAEDSSTGGAPHGKLGVIVHALTPEEKSAFKLSSGLVVDEATGRAARAGIQAGDIILSVNGTQVKTVEQLRAIVSKEGKYFALLIKRDDVKIFVPIEFD